MNGKQYNNVINDTLRCRQCSDPLSTAKQIFQKLEIALPQGDLKQICQALETNEHTGWRACTRQEAQEAADQGIAAMGINENEILILAANDAETPVAIPVPILLPSRQTADKELIYYSYAAAVCPPASEEMPTYPADQLTGIQRFSCAADGDTYLSKNFKVREFRCNDGSDEIFIDMALVRCLQALRDWAGAAITITSGYRTPSHNEEIGGAKYSKHIWGMAADIVCSAKSPRQLAQKAESLGMQGIEWNDALNYTHIDTRSGKWYAKYIDEDYHTGYLDIASFYESY